MGVIIIPLSQEVEGGQVIVIGNSTRDKKEEKADGLEEWEQWVEPQLEPVK